MSTEKKQQFDNSELLDDINFVNQANKNEAQRINEQFQRLIAEADLAGNAADSIIAEVSSQLGQLSYKVNLAEQSICSIQNERKHKSTPNARSSSNFARPIFITSIPHCGSSLVGEVLGSCHGARYIFEPFNSQWMPALRGQVGHFRYVSSQSETPPVLKQVAVEAFRGKQGWKQVARAVYRGYLGAVRRPANRIMIEDATASLMAGWLAQNFHTQTLIVMRHPCGFASSIETMGWPRKVNFILNQKELMQDHLEPFRGTLLRSRKDKWLRRGAIWGAMHTVFARQLACHPDWRMVKYEDLCDNPVGQYESLAEEFGLELNSRTRQKLKSTGDSGDSKRNGLSMPDSWRQSMSPGEIDAVMGVVSEFGLGYYKI